MTDREKAIVMAYTGICMLAGDKFQIFHKYIEDIMGRPIYTHEIGLLADTIKEKAEADFMALCADEGSSENPNKCFDGMTNGEVIDLLFPGADIYHNRDFTLREMIFPDEWWDTPYKAESEVSE